MLRLVWLALMFAASAPLAASTDPTPTCAGLMAAVESSLKSAASASASTVADSSAHRANLAELKIANELSLVAINLQLMRDNGCVMPRDPIYAGRYALDALKCEADMREVFTGKIKLEPGSVLPPSCNRNNWRPVIPDPPKSANSSSSGSG